MKQRLIQLLIFAITAYTLTSLSSCGDVIKDPISNSLYFIDNQSSYVLSYDVMDPAFDIIIGATTEVLAQTALGDAAIQPIDAFEVLAGDIGTNVFLYRDSSGVQLEALQLNAAPDLMWINERQGNNVFHYTLMVTDDLIR